MADTGTIICNKFNLKFWLVINLKFFCYFSAIKMITRIASTVQWPYVWHVAKNTLVTTATSKMQGDLYFAFDQRQSKEKLSRIVCHRASSLKQQSTGRLITPLYYPQLV